MRLLLLIFLVTHSFNSYSYEFFKFKASEDSYKYFYQICISDTDNCIEMDEDSNISEAIYDLDDIYQESIDEDSNIDNDYSYNAIIKNYNY